MKFKVPWVVFDHKGNVVKILLFKAIFSISFKIIFIVFTKIEIMKGKSFMWSMPFMLNLSWDDGHACYIYKNEKKNCRYKI
jgi:uncharacterized MAPEG superfamily protein